MPLLELKNEKGIVVYGTGYYANKVYWYLKYRGILDEVRFFVVSDGEQKETDYLGIPVFYLSEKTEEMRELQVIVAISPKKSESIVLNLLESGVKDVSAVTTEFAEDIKKEYFLLCNKYPVKRNKILFDVNNGLGFMCNPKYIAKRLIEMGADAELVWGVVPAAVQEFPDGVRLVGREDEEYCYEMATSGIIVCNTTINIPLIKQRSQYIINTWHGIGPFKRVGVKHDGLMGVSGWKESVLKWTSKTDLMLAASDHCPGVYRDSLGYKGEIARWGYPRNDILFGDLVKTRRRVCERIGIDPEDGIVLYAPTYRVDVQLLHEAGVEEKYNLRMDRVVASLENRYGKKYTPLYRLHQLIYRDPANHSEGYHNDGIDVTMYPDMMELLATVDVLITDWSSSIWDFSLTRKQGKRVFLYQNDIERATELNGFYMPPDQLPFPKGRTTEELCEAILTYDDDQYMRDVDGFFEKYGCYDDGHASERVAERIIDVIEHPDKYGKDGVS